MTALQEELPVEVREIQGRPYFVSIEPLMSVGEVAQYARVTPATVYRAQADGLLTAGRARTAQGNGANGRLVFRRTDVDAWLFAEPEEKPKRPRRQQLPPVEPIPVSPRSRRRREP
jgi:hypothetical protein